MLDLLLQTSQPLDQAFQAGRGRWGVRRTVAGILRQGRVADDLGELFKGILVRLVDEVALDVPDILGVLVFLRVFVDLVVGRILVVLGVLVVLVVFVVLRVFGIFGVLVVLRVLGLLMVLGVFI